MDITALLQQYQRGNASAQEQLYPLIYDELRRIAHLRLRNNRGRGTLNTTALVHEAYLRLTDQTVASAKDRHHFFALSSHAMRFILVDYARSKATDKRYGADLPLSNVEVGEHMRAGELVALDEALEELSRHNERLGGVVEYKFFGGMTFEEIAELMGVSLITAKRDWQRARIWLYEFMNSEA